MTGSGRVWGNSPNPLWCKGLPTVSNRSGTSSVTRLRNAAIPSRHGQAAKSTQSGQNLQRLPVSQTGVDLMPVNTTDLIRAVPSIIPSDTPALSDDECLLRLARAIEDHDFEHLDEVARLIGRLIVTIE
jgi:hypothetical protein